MSTTKSNVRITSIRTGHGDTGDTKLGGKTYRKGHLLVQYSSALDIVQSYTNAIPRSFGDYEPRILIQEALFRLGAAIGSRKPKDQEMPLQEITTLMERQIDVISGGLAPLDSFIRVNETNFELHRLRGVVREAESKCVAARDFIEFESKDLVENLLYMLNKSIITLNVMSDWVFAYVWLFSTDQKGKVLDSTKWIPWTEETFIKLN